MRSPTFSNSKISERHSLWQLMTESKAGRSMAVPTDLLVAVTPLTECDIGARLFRDAANTAPVEEAMARHLRKIG